jgi:hypothetical protein
MIRLMVGIQKRVLGLVELDDEDPSASLHVTGFDLMAAQPPLASNMIVNILIYERRLGETDLNLIRALPERLRGYTWARDVSLRAKPKVAL